MLGRVHAYIRSGWLAATHLSLKLPALRSELLVASTDLISNAKTDASSTQIPLCARLEFQILRILSVSCAPLKVVLQIAHVGTGWNVMRIEKSKCEPPALVQQLFEMPGELEHLGLRRVREHR